MDKLKHFLSRHAGSVLSVGIAVLVAGGMYGFGLFSLLGDGTDNFFANDTPAAQVNQKITDVFGSDDTKNSVILFEAKNRSANVRDAQYAAEVASILKNLDTKTVTSYYTTGSDQFISRDGNDTYVVVTLDGTNDEQYKALTAFSDDVNSDKFTVSVGGTLVGQQQTQTQAKDDLSMAEMISLPILAILLFWFFRGPVAAAIPLLMSLFTIAGGLAVARLIHTFVAIDTYTLNVITILGVGLSIDYSLLAVNRFREELHTGKTPAEAARKTTRTAGRTIIFSGMTVIICLLSMLLFPVGFMRSVSIGGAAAVLVAVLISTFLLPPALQLIGKNIDKWSMKPRRSVKQGWHKLAVAVTKRPYVTLGVGLVIIAALVWPVGKFETKTFDWHVLPSNQSAYHVGKVMSERFNVATPTLTVLAKFDETPTVMQLCNLAKTVAAVQGVDSVQAAYAPTEQLSDCTTMSYALQTLKVQAPQQAALLEATSAKYTKDTYARVEVVPSYEASDSRIRNVMTALEKADYGTDVSISIGGVAARSQDTHDVYKKWAPYVIVVIAVAMIIILGLSLGSLVIPLQAILMNSLALFISLGVLIMIFQFGWAQSFLPFGVTGGFELSIPILAFVIAFGLSMDYAVFLYSRMHEVYDTTDDPAEAIVDGVVRTGPIITAAALLLFVVVASFATSHIVIIQQIGVGLAIAVLVDAFFVRIFFVAAIMQLFGRASWWGPKWLKKITIKHE